MAAAKEPMWHTSVGQSQSDSLDLDFLPGGFLDGEDNGMSSVTGEMKSIYNAQRFQHICGQHDKGEKILEDHKEKQKDLEEILNSSQDHPDEEQLEKCRKTSRKVMESCRHFSESFMPGEHFPILAISETSFELQISGDKTIKTVNFAEQEQESCTFRVKFDSVDSLSEKMLLYIVTPCQHFLPDVYLDFREKIMSRTNVKKLLDLQLLDFVALACRSLRIQPIAFGSTFDSFVEQISDRLSSRITCHQSLESPSTPDVEEFCQVLTDFRNLNWEKLCATWSVDELLVFCSVCVKLAICDRFLSESHMKILLFDLIGNYVLSYLPESRWIEFRARLPREIEAIPTDLRNFPAIFGALGAVSCEINARKEEMMCSCFAAFSRRFLETTEFENIDLKDCADVKPLLPIMEALFDRVGSEIADFDKEYEIYVIIQCLNFTLTPSLIEKTSRKVSCRVRDCLRRLGRCFGESGRLNHILLKTSLDSIYLKLRTFMAPPPPAELEAQLSSPKKQLGQWSTYEIIPSQEFLKEDDEKESDNEGEVLNLYIESEDEEQIAEPGGLGKENFPDIDGDQLMETDAFKIKETGF